ncbi:MAG: PIG-L family deacetylase [Hamadaea sp.]|nr:PIG-L family deacetylase [Hamadaea sp.]
MRLSRRAKIIIAILVVLALLPVGLVYGLFRYVNDTSVPVADSLLPDDGPKKLLAIFAHPDDEITVAGSLRRMSEQDGSELTLAYLTRGEAADVPKQSPQELAGRRTVEVDDARKELGVDHLELFDYPDGGLPAVDPAGPEKVISDLVDKYRPTVVISFDEKIGFYGHEDHAQVGRWVADVMRERRAEAGFPVQRYYQATLPQSMIKVAKQLSPTFQERYPDDPALGLPAPTVAMSIVSAGARKRAALDAHVSQTGILQAVQPGYDQLPSWIYFRILSREYFTRIF